MNLVSSKTDFLKANFYLLSNCLKALPIWLEFDYNSLNLLLIEFRLLCETKDCHIVQLGLESVFNFLALNQIITTLNANHQTVWLNTDNDLDLENNYFESFHNYNFSKFAQFSSLNYLNFDKEINEFQDKSISLLVLNASFNLSELEYSNLIAKMADKGIIFFSKIENSPIEKFWLYCMESFPYQQIFSNQGMVAITSQADTNLIQEIRQLSQDIALPSYTELLRVELFKNSQFVLNTDDNYLSDTLPLENNYDIKISKKAKLYKSFRKLFPRKKLMPANYINPAETYSREINQQIELIKNSGYFDENWYLNKYPQVKNNYKNIVAHYLLYGYKEGKSPGSNFDNNFYLQENSDVAASNQNPLLHYITSGKTEKRAANIKERIKFESLNLIDNCSYFDEKWYLDNYPQIEKLRIKPSLHFLIYGYKEGKNPGAEFDTNWYLDYYPDVKALNLNPLIHYLQTKDSDERYINQNDLEIKNNLKLIKNSGYFDENYYLENYPQIKELNIEPALHYLLQGFKEGYNPGSEFDNNWYINFYPDVKARNLNPLIHYVKKINGNLKLIKDSELFDESYYLNKYPQVKELDIDPALHYLLYGYKEGCNPNPKFDTNWYLNFYPDVKEFNVNPLIHYLESGIQENRYVNIEDFCGIKLEEDKLAILNSNGKGSLLIVSHESSRTGAPILVYNLIKELKKNYNIITLTLNSGEIARYFHEVSDYFIEPNKSIRELPDLLSYLIHRINKICPLYYAIGNSADSVYSFAGLVSNDIPSVSLIHEFATYYQDNISYFEQLSNQADQIVFSTKSTMNNALEHCTVFAKKKISVLHQGYGEIPGSLMNNELNSPKNIAMENYIKSIKGNSFFVFGCGTINIRKGVDLFVACADNISKNYPDLDIKFVWIGSKFKYDRLASYTAYLDYYVDNINLTNSLFFIDEIENMELIYKNADLLFLSSRLDPLPNIAIDAMAKGIPVIAFDKSGGVSDILGVDEMGKNFLAAYLDINKASELIVKLAKNNQLYVDYANKLKLIANEKFNMKNYITKLDEIGKKARLNQKNRYADYEIIKNDDLFNENYYLPKDLAIKLKSRDEAIIKYLKKYCYCQKFKSFTLNYIGLVRKPLAGFNQQIYNDLIDTDNHDPLAHYILNKQPKGSWISEILDNKYNIVSVNSKNCLHIHMYYIEVLAEIINAINVNTSNCDLFFTTSSNENKIVIGKALEKYNKGNVEIEVVKNIGRDVKPLLTDLADKLAHYDIIGHLHAKKSLDIIPDNLQFGDIWRQMLWQNLLGDKYPMMDVILSKFQNDSNCGIIFPDDPHLCNWSGNLPLAKSLANKLKLKNKLPNFFNFPIGTMFWARREVLKPFFDLKLEEFDYPVEPIDIDGTILHALERLFAIVSEDLGYKTILTYLSDFSR